MSTRAFNGLGGYYITDRNYLDMTVEDFCRDVDLETLRRTQRGLGRKTIQEIRDVLAAVTFK